MTLRGVRPLAITALQVVAAISVIGILASLRMNYDAKLAPFLAEGRIGEPVEARAFTVTVRAVELAQAVAAQEDAEQITSRSLSSGAVWVVVHLRLAARYEPISLMTANLVTADGYDYAAAGPRVEGAGSLPYSRRLLNLKMTAPGLDSEGLLLFEVPRTRLAGLRLRVSQAAAGARLDSLTDIDLGIDAPKLAALLDHVLPQFTVRGYDR